MGWKQITTSHYYQKNEEEHHDTVWYNRYFLELQEVYVPSLKLLSHVQSNFMSLVFQY